MYSGAGGVSYYELATISVIVGSSLHFGAH